MLAIQRQHQRAAKLLVVLTEVVRSRPWLSMVLGGLLATLLRRLYDWLLRRQQGRLHWRRHIDLCDLQACIMSTEHLGALGRVEKRTLFVKPLAEVFTNQFILSRVLEAAERAAASGDPMLIPQLSQEDRWHVLNTCTNHLSACFAPYHVFFNEARRAQSMYKSAWYCFTLTCHQTAASGRWFITPLKPVDVGDVGVLRIRIVLMNEQELREIVSGAIEPPSFGFFNGRHESRWRVCQRFADLFGSQLQRVTGSSDVNGDWGRNLCGRMSQGVKRRTTSNPSLMGTPSRDRKADPDENSILRMHVPFPAITAGEHDEDRRQVSLEDNVSKDVVLFE